MIERLRQKVFLALACCLALIVIPLPQISAQTQSDTVSTWLAAKGNLHYLDEDGNYMINAVQPGSVKSGVVQKQTTREKPSQAKAQITPLTWRDSNGNLHYRDEGGNYMINAGKT